MQSNYEFTGPQNTEFAELSKKMGFIAVFLLVLGALYCCAGALGTLLLAKLGGLLEPTFLATYNIEDHARSLFMICAAAAVVFFCTAFWMRGASVRFQAIVKTQGSDVELLMSAMRALNRLYRLWSVVLAAGLLLGLILLVRTMLSHA